MPDVALSNSYQAHGLVRVGVSCFEDEAAPLGGRKVSGGEDKDVPA